MVVLSPRRRAVILLSLGAATGALMVTRPRQLGVNGESVDVGTSSCLSNLGQISRAYALYARDYDGKIPRGVDPEDRSNPSIWQDIDGGGSKFYETGATQAPYLHQILRPYVASREVFHCPADVGWDVTRLPAGSASLTNVHPSAFGRFGTSYLCWTVYGFNLNRADDIANPSETLLLFDGDCWHTNAGRQLINGLFADGHVQNLTAQQFTYYSPRG